MTYYKITFSIEPPIFGLFEYDGKTLKLISQSDFFMDEYTTDDIDKSFDWCYTQKLTHEEVNNLKVELL